MGHKWPSVVDAVMSHVDFLSALRYSFPEMLEVLEGIIRRRKLQGLKVIPLQGDISIQGLVNGEGDN